MIIPRENRRLGLVLLSVLAGIVLPAALAAQALTPQNVRALIDSRTGGIHKLRVPGSDLDLPQPRLPSGEIDPRFRITEAKRYLGKLLYHDPIRSANIRPELGGDPTTRQTASCGSCHLGEAASKAGEVINIAVGGEGRMKMDAYGNIRLERRLIPGIVDLIPTPLEKRDAAGNLLLDGKFDAVDSVARLSPSMVGFAFNNRLLGDGAAGEPFDPGNPLKANKNPDNLPAGESLTQIAIAVHRMAEGQHLELQNNAVYRRLFADAFPEAHAISQASGNLDLLINDDTVLRALAAFLRTVITRNTPWDRFLAGDDSALTLRQLRGARLFAAPIHLGGADCISCHSGPALNKQLGDEAGLLVDENFINLGLKEHPLRDLARAALEDPNHRDNGRQGVTADPAHAFQFKTPTLRQLKNAGQFMHSGEFSTIRAVVEYFNRGVPSNPIAAAAGNVPARFTHPRGPGVSGLALSSSDIDALVDFLDNALFDPAFETHDPRSSTRTFDPNPADLTYPDYLKALGARDGLLPSKMAVGNDDALTRAQTIFVRGEVNRDGSVDISDGIYILGFMFFGGPEPYPMMAADANYDGKFDIADPVYLLRFLFYGGNQPPMPFPEPGQFMH